MIHIDLPEAGAERQLQPTKKAKPGIELISNRILKQFRCHAPVKGSCSPTGTGARQAGLMPVGRQGT
jgi:hypothetical protein